MADNTRWRLVTLRSSDVPDNIIMVEEAVAKQSQFLKRIIEQRVHHFNDNNYVIEIPFVTRTILMKVLDYCGNRVSAAAATVAAAAATSTTTSSGVASGSGAADELMRWEEEFVRSLESEPETLRAVMAAATNLDIKSLVDLLREAVARMEEGKPENEVREMFDLNNNVTAADEAVA